MYEELLKNANSNYLNTLKEVTKSVDSNNTQKFEPIFLKRLEMYGISEKDLSALINFRSGLLSVSEKYTQPCSTEIGKLSGQLEYLTSDEYRFSTDKFLVFAGLSEKDQFISLRTKEVLPGKLVNIKLFFNENNLNSVSLLYFPLKHPKRIQNTKLRTYFYNSKSGCKYEKECKVFDGMIPIEDEKNEISESEFFGELQKANAPSLPLFMNIIDKFSKKDQKSIQR